MVQNIHIQINRLKLYKVSVSNALNINVIHDVPFDDQSKRFNKYRHMPKYTPGTEYNPSDYELCLDDPNAWYYTYILYLYKPTKKILSVDIFFDSNDNERRNPLIFGFNHADNTSVYYSYYHLRGIKYFTGTLGTDGLITKEDLITRLIDERGLYITESYNKFIIRLGDKPNTTPVEYPKSGQNKLRILLNKLEPPKYHNYVKFEHVINKLNNVESFYLSFHQDTMYMNADRLSGKLKEVDVYYNKHDGENPVVIVLKFQSRTKLYKFSSFYSDLPKKHKNISDLENYSEDYLEKTLIEEYKRVKKEITFKRGPGTNRYISETAHRFHLGHMDEFRRVILRPNTDDSKKGSSSGPYEVYNDNLLKKYSDTKLDDHFLDSIHDKSFSSIYVYFTSRYEPLLIGFIGESENKFFGISKGGKSWVDEDDSINIYNDRALIPKLRQLEKANNDSDFEEPVQIRVPHQAGQTHYRTITTLTEQPKSITIKLDLSSESGSSYEYGKVQYIRKDYYECDLFCYFIHSLKDNSTFEISSITHVKLSKKINNVTAVFKEVKSVNVYFNKYNLYNPVMIGITPKVGKTIYYKDLIQSDSTYPFSKLKTVEEKNLTNELINEADEVNKSVTCQLDKTTENTDNYGINSLISMTKQDDDKYGFCIFTHKQSAGKPFKGYVLFNNKTLVGWTNNRKTSLSFQDKMYKMIKVYVLETDTKFPLIIEFIEQTMTTYYIKNQDEKGDYWSNLTIKPDGVESIKSKLIEINYPLKNSVVVEIDQKNPDQLQETNYQMKMILNEIISNGQYKNTKYEDAQSVLSKSVNVSVTNKMLDSSTKSYSPFNYVSHELEKLNSQTINRSDIAGIRFFINKSVGIKPEEIFFYETQDNANRSTNRLNLYYPPQSQSKKIYVYFYDDDPRPLLVCYDGKVYKKLTDITKWVFVRKVNCSDSAEVLKILKEIYGTMKKKITLEKDGNKDNNINIKKDQNFGSFKQDTYTVKLEKSQKTSLKLPIRELVENLENYTSLYNLLNILFKKSFDSINVYKKSNGVAVKNILVFEFINEAEKIHIFRKDDEGNYWVRQPISENINEALSKINSEITNTLFYEINNKSDYNNKIKLTSYPNVLKNGFTKYTHSPKDGGVKTTTILYNGENLVEKVGESYKVISKLKNQNYEDLIVYFGTKINHNKKAFPLLIQLNTNKSSSSIFYKHKRVDNKFFWEQTNIRTGYKDQLMINLNKTEFELADSIVVLMNQKKPKYGDTEIKDAIKKLKVFKHINLPGIDKESIPVEQSHSTSCFHKNGFNVYDHNISRIRGRNESGIKFFMFTSDKNKYVDLSLYSDDTEFEEFLYYDDNHQKAHIYFYGSDPRPLMLYYGNSAFRPHSTNYELKWHKIRGNINTNCDFNGNSNLLRELCNVVGLLNVVKLEIIPSSFLEIKGPYESSRTTSTYQIQKYNGDGIYIKISYENMSCFRCYIHTPMQSGYRLGIITYNSSSDIGIDYDLTKPLKSVNVYYNVFDISHQYPLLVVLGFEGGLKEYYRLREKTRKVWTIVSRSHDANLFSKLSDISKIEEGLYEIKKDIDVSFDSSSKNYLFIPENCEEASGPSTTTIAAATGGGVTTAALVGAGTTIATHPEWIIPVIRALT